MKPIDWDKVRVLCGIQCTQREIATVFEITAETLHERCVKENGMNFSDYFSEHRVTGWTSLRHKQFEVAMKGNSRMLTWLGENWIGQSRHANVRHSGGVDLRAVADLDKLSDDQAELLLKLLEQADAKDSDEVHTQAG